MSGAQVSSAWVARQTYLIGDSLFLRAPELEDAKWATAWNSSPFPISAKLAEDQLQKQLADEPDRGKWRLIACRRDDGRPVGSAMVEDMTSSIISSLSLHSDPSFGNRGAAIQAEMLGLVATWLSKERNRPLVVLVTDDSLDPVVKTAQRIGMRRAAQLREAAWRDGSLHDRVYFELHHPAWLSRFGDPVSGIDHAAPPVSTPRAPAIRRDPDENLPLPPKALIGSERLALRPMQTDDAATIAALLRAEPEADFGHERLPSSPVTLAKRFGKMSADDPAKTVEFAIVLRESGEIIGENGIYDIDWLARNGESGTWIYRPEYRNAGYGTEAKHLLLEYAFERLGLHMIWAQVKSRNPRSQAALRKQGYRDAGQLSWTNFGPEGLVNTRIFDLLASEWRAARQGA